MSKKHYIFILLILFLLLLIQGADIYLLNKVSVKDSEYFELNNIEGKTITADLQFDSKYDFVYDFKVYKRQATKNNQTVIHINPDKNTESMNLVIYKKGILPWNSKKVFKSTLDEADERYIYISESGDYNIDISKNISDNKDLSMDLSIIQYK